MRWSIPVGRIFGISLRLHVTFLLLLAFFAYQGYAGGGVAGAGWTLALVCSLFTCVVLHELGHSVVAQQLGVEVKSSTLMPIGGVASLRTMPENPWHEIAITVAGPLVNLVIACVLFLFTGWPQELFATHIPQNLTGLMRVLTGLNLGLFLFNFIPAFPMDGGRLLRALLALALPYTRATHIAATIGQGLAIVFVLVGLQRMSPTFIILGAFIFLAAEGEEKMVRMRGLLREVFVDEIMTREFATLAPTDTVARGLALVYRTGQDDFPVVTEGEVVGLVTRSAMVSVVNTRGDQVLVADIMDPDPPAIAPHNKVSWAHEQMSQGQFMSFPVLERGRLIGLLTPDNISRYLLVQQSLKAARRGKPVPPIGAAQIPTPPPVIARVPPVATPPAPAAPLPPSDRA